MMNTKKIKDILKKELAKYEFEIENVLVGIDEQQDCLKIILAVSKLDINLKDLKDIIETVLYYYTDKYVLLLDIK